MSKYFEGKNSFPRRGNHEPSPPANVLFRLDAFTLLMYAIPREISRSKPNRTTKANRFEAFERVRREANHFLITIRPEKKSLSSRRCFFCLLSRRLLHHRINSSELFFFFSFDETGWSLRLQLWIRRDRNFSHSWIRLLMTQRQFFYCLSSFGGSSATVD